MNYKQEFEDAMVELLKKAWHEGEAEGIRRAEAGYNKGYEQGLNDAWECAKLDKIRAEIDQYLFQNEFGSEYRKEVSQIIDKYKAEIERKPCINYEDGCEEWAGCPCVDYKAEREVEE